MVVRTTCETLLGIAERGRARLDSRRDGGPPAKKIADNNRLREPHRGNSARLMPGGGGMPPGVVFCA
jgi:hypothetical protein